MRVVSLHPLFETRGFYRHQPQVFKPVVRVKKGRAGIKKHLVRMARWFYLCRPASKKIKFFRPVLMTSKEKKKTSEIFGGKQYGSYLCTPK
jgi:hypothetical protein